MKGIKLPIMLILSGLLVLCIVSHASKTNQQNTAGQTEEVNYINQVQEEQERIAEPIEEFGSFLEEIHITGQKSILENYVISRVLESEEIDWLVENSSGLIHLEIEKTSPLRSYENLGGDTIVISADVDGDGIEDIITSNCDDYPRENLYIYLGLGNGDYQLSYAQPTLRIEEYDHKGPMYGGFYHLEVVRYKEESYLLFRGGLEYYLRGAHLIEGKVKEGFVFEYWCKNVNSEGMHIEELQGGTEELRIRWFSDDDLYHYIYDLEYDKHCDIYDLLDDYEVWEELENGEDEIIEEERKQQILDQYQRRRGEEIRPVHEILDHFYRSDINNDGIEEEYYKERNRTYEIFLDGRYYGNYVHGSELSYYMETGGEETDFEEMCGLALWNQGMIPLYFFVQEGEEGNITYIAYRDSNNHEMRLDGYLIQSDHYERVASMSLVPELACRMNHWSDPYTENAGYFIFCSEDMKSIEFLYAEENSMEDQVNQNVRRLLETKAEELREKKNSFLRVYYEISRTAKESAKLECRIVYWDEEEGDEVYSGSFYFIVDLTTGEIKEVEREEFLSSQYMRE